MGDMSSARITEDRVRELLVLLGQGSGAAVSSFEELRALCTGYLAMAEALREITRHSFVPLFNSNSTEPAEEAARALYGEWKACLDTARAALGEQP